LLIQKKNLSNPFNYINPFFDVRRVRKLRMKRHANLRTVCSDETDSGFVLLDYKPGVL